MCWAADGFDPKQIPSHQCCTWNVNTDTFVLQGSVAVPWYRLVIYSPKNFKGIMSAHQRKPQMQDVFRFINICPTNYIQLLSMHIFKDFDFQSLFRTWMKMLMLVLGFFPDEKRSFKECANIVYPKASRDCPLFTTNHTSAERVENLPGRPPNHIEMGLNRIGGSTKLMVMRTIMIEIIIMTKITQQQQH